MKKQKQVSAFFRFVRSFSAFLLAPIFFRIPFLVFMCFPFLACPHLFRMGFVLFFRFVCFFVRLFTSLFAFSFVIFCFLDLLGVCFCLFYVFSFWICICLCFLLLLLLFGFACCMIQNHQRYAKWLT